MTNLILLLILLAFSYSFSAQKYSLGESCVVSSGPITSYQSSVTPFESMLSGVELTGQ